MQLVLSISVIQSARHALEEQRSHEQIILYLALLKQRAEKGPDAELSTEMLNEDLRRWLKVPTDGDFCYYRPFTSRGDSFWMNNNLAGSYAPSSLRGDKQGLFYGNDGVPCVPDAKDVKAVLLKSKAASPLPAWAVAGYLFRNALLATGKESPDLNDLVILFRKVFGIDENDQNYSLIFDFSLPSGIDEIYELVDSSGKDSNSDTLTIIDQDYRILNNVELGIESKPRDAVASNPLQSDDIKTGSASEIEAKIIEALELYSGVILSGAPGTSKSYYAEKVASLLTKGDYERMRFTQFHASYQFEDFIQGYTPDPEGGSFKQKDGIFLSLCKDALDDPDNNYVVIIDELSRGDSCRVFGEALTYIEKTKRGRYFYLPSGDQMTIPSNVYVIATMNPIDRGADEVDVAFGRRFATIDMEPSIPLLENRLKENGIEDELRGKLIQWFSDTNGICKKLELAGVGHAYFWNVKDVDSLRKAWNLQVKHHLRRSFGMHINERDGIEDAMNDVLG